MKQQFHMIQPNIANMIWTAHTASTPAVCWSPEIRHFGAILCKMQEDLQGSVLNLPTEVKYLNRLTAVHPLLRRSSPRRLCLWGFLRTHPASNG